MLGAFDLQDPKPPASEGVGRGQGLSIRPEVFLYPPWHGTGLICDGFGLPSDRYTVRGRGRTEADGAVVIEHRAEFDSGIVNAYEWRFGAPQGDAVYARDLLNGLEAKGRMTAVGFRWTFIAVGHTPFGRRRCRVEIDYRMLSPQDASSTVTLSLFGVTVATGTSHIRHDAMTDSKAA